MAMDGYCDHFTEDETMTAILSVGLELAIGRQHLRILYDKALAFFKDISTKVMDVIFEDRDIQIETSRGTSGEPGWTCSRRASSFAKSSARRN